MTATTSTDRIKGTTKELAAKWGVEQPVAAGFIKFLREKGIATEDGIQKPASGKGKGAAIYSIPATITLNCEATENPEPGTPITTGPTTTTLPGGHTIPVGPKDVAVCYQTQPATPTPGSTTLSDPAVQQKANDILNMPEPTGAAATTKTDEAGAA